MEALAIVSIVIAGSAHAGDPPKADGSLSSPYRVRSAEDLDDVRNGLHAHYFQLADIDLSSIDNWEPIGEEYDGFTGSFNGNGYTISNLTIVGPCDVPNGLFGFADGAAFSKIKLEDVDISCGHVVGGLVALGKDLQVTGCSSSGSVSGGSGGGLVGRILGGTIANSSSSATVGAGPRSRRTLRAAPAQSILYVDDDASGANDGTSWESAFNELQSALKVAQAYDQIWVAIGTYRPDYDVGTGQHTGDREATFQLISGVAIYGGFDGTESTLEERAGLFDQTVLTGDLLGNDGPDFTNNDENAFHVVFALTVDQAAILDGFMITAGNANGAPFTDQNAGGGVFNRSPPGNPSLSRPVLVNCVIRRNSGKVAGGMWDFRGEPTLINCAFIRNRTTGDFGDGGAIYTVNGAPTLIQCIFVGNSAKRGAGIWNQSDSILTGCVFYGNSAELFGGGLSTSFDLAIGTNCIFWNNTPEQVAESAGGTTALAYSCVQGGWPGVGNIDADPLFVRNPDPGPDGEWGTEDDDYGNLRLLPGSPCIDAANNTSVPIDEFDLDEDGDTEEPVPFDLDGNPRFVDDPETEDTGFGDSPIVDMGAYELQPVDLCIDDDADGKVTLCHIPPGNPDNAHTISVSVNAVAVHLMHGDHCGPCELEAKVHELELALEELERQHEQIPQEQGREIEEIERRLHHMHEAVEHLHAAELHEPAERIMEHAAQLERELDKLRRGHHEGHELERRVQELTEEVHNLRAEVRELREMIKRLQKRVAKLLSKKQPKKEKAERKKR